MKIPIIESTHGDWPRLVSVPGEPGRFRTRTALSAHYPVKVYKNGLLQSPGAGQDYTIEWDLIGTIQLAVVPDPETDKITVEYWPMEAL